jgi:hypothetical protein
VKVLRRIRKCLDFWKASKRSYGVGVKVWNVTFAPGLYNWGKVFWTETVESTTS